MTTGRGLLARLAPRMGPGAEEAGLKTRAVTSVLSLGLAQGTSYAFRFASMAILARLLEPDLFGVLGLATAIVLVLMDVTDLGLGAALVQRQDPSETDLSTVFWFSMSLSLGVCALLWLGSDALALWLREERLAPVLRLLAVLLPISTLAMIPYTLLQREMAFGRVSVRVIGSEIAFGVVGVSLALSGAEMWSLVGAIAAQWVARTLLTWLVHPWWPRFVLDLKALRSMMSFSLSAFAVSLASRLMAQLDYFLIGRYLGMTALGYYTIAFQLVAVPPQRLTGVLKRVMIPGFSRIKNDMGRLKKGTLLLIEVLALVLVPLSAFIAIAAPWLVRALYSAKWDPAIVPAQILALAIWGYGFDVAQATYYAADKPHWWLGLLGLRTTLFVALAAAFGLTWGASGVALSAALAVAISSAVGLGSLSRMIGADWRSIMRRMQLPLYATLLASIPALAARFTLADLSSPWLGVIGSGGLMLLIYGGIVLWRYRGHVPAARTWLVESSRRMRGAIRPLEPADITGGGAAPERES